MNGNSRNYNISIREISSDNEGLFEARVRELPDIVEYAETANEAYDLALDSIETTSDYFSESGRAMPSASIPEDDFSGRITLRMGKTLHRAVSEAAEADCVSLNQHLVGVIAFHTGYGYCTRILSKANWFSVDQAPQKSSARKSRQTLYTVIQDNESFKKYAVN